MSTQKERAAATTYMLNEYIKKANTLEAQLVEEVKRREKVEFSLEELKAARFDTEHAKCAAAEESDLYRPELNKELLLIARKPIVVSILYDLNLLPEQLSSQEKLTRGLFAAYNRLEGVLLAFKAAELMEDQLCNQLAVAKERKEKAEVLSEERRKSINKLALRAMDAEKRAEKAEAAIDLALQLFDPDYPDNPTRFNDRGVNRALEILRAALPSKEQPE